MTRAALSDLSDLSAIGGEKQYRPREALTSLQRTAQLLTRSRPARGRGGHRRRFT